MENLTLLSGNHTERAQGLCVMEAVAFFAGEPHSDAPECACRVIASFARRLNDRLDDAHRQGLKDLIPALALSRGDRALTVKRAYIAADFAVRRFAPETLDLRGFGQYAARLRALAPVVDQVTAEAARREARAAYDAAVAAYDAAYADAAYAAVAAYDAAVAAYDAAAYADAAYADAAAAAAAVAVAAAKSGKVATYQERLLTNGLALIHAMLAA